MTMTETVEQGSPFHLLDARYLGESALSLGESEPVEGQLEVVPVAEIVQGGRDFSSHTETIGDNLDTLQETDESIAACSEVISDILGAYRTDRSRLFQVNAEMESNHEAQTQLPATNLQLFQDLVALQEEKARIEEEMQARLDAREPVNVELNKVELQLEKHARFLSEAESGTPSSGENIDQILQQLYDSQYAASGQSDLHKLLDKLTAEIEPHNRALEPIIGALSDVRERIANNLLTKQAYEQIQQELQARMQALHAESLYLRPRVVKVERIFRALNGVAAIQTRNKEELTEKTDGADS